MAMQLGQQIAVDFDVPARMRDGTILRANVYRPVGEGKWPVLLTRLPYGKDFPIGTSVLDPTQVARRGYVVIIQDTRGRMRSGGEWMPFINEALDGVDTIEWASSCITATEMSVSMAPPTSAIPNGRRPFTSQRPSKLWYPLSPGTTP